MARISSARDLLVGRRRDAGERVDELAEVLQAPALLEQADEPLERLAERRVGVVGGEVVARRRRLVARSLLEVGDLRQQPRTGACVRAVAASSARSRRIVPSSTASASGAAELGARDGVDVSGSGGWLIVGVWDMRGRAYDRFSTRRVTQSRTLTHDKLRGKSGRPAGDATAHDRATPTPGGAFFRAAG